MKKERYQYLYQLIWTSIILILLPTIFFYSVIWKSSFKEIKQLNTEYYDSILQMFSGAFVNEVSEFKDLVNVFSVNSRKNASDGGIFYEGTSKMKEHNYYFSEASCELMHYSQKIGYDSVGVYYYDEDIILIDGFKYSADLYINRIVPKEKQGEEDRVKEFFGEEQYEPMKVIFAPLSGREGKNQDILIGICTTLGKDKEKALMFYKLERDKMEMFYLSAEGHTYEKYYVLDHATQEILYSIGNTAEEFIKEHDNAGQFVMNHSFFGITFVVDVSGDEAQNRVEDFYYDMKLFFAYIILVMLVISIGVVYINYKPINRLLRNVKCKGKNEFDSILNFMEQQSGLMNEQRIMIMDLLMNHLIYGIPITQKYVETLGIGRAISCYCVFVIKKRVLRNNEMELIIREVEESLRTLIFITDLRSENSTVLIVFMEYDKSESVKAWLEEWCQSHIAEEYQLHMGCVVEKMDDIQKSFAFYMNDKKTASPWNEKAVSMEIQTVSEKFKNQEKINERLKKEVLTYLDEHYTNPNLSQVQVADHFQISVYSLSKLFNGYIGIGFSRYINNKRIEYAKELLVSTKLSVREIANMVGISDENYFSRVFRKHTGVSPVYFRTENE